MTTTNLTLAVRMVSLMGIVLGTSTRATAAGFEPNRFYVGMYGVESAADLADLSGHFDFAQSYNKGYVSEDPAAFMDACAAQGIMCLPTLGVELYNDTAITSLLNLIKDKPAYAGLFIADEPGCTWVNTSLATCLAAKNTIVALDPNPAHKLILDSFVGCNLHGSDISYFQSCYDIFVDDHYPWESDCPVGDVGCSTINSLSTFVDQYQSQTLAVGKPWWHAPQVGNVNDTGSHVFNEPDGLNDGTGATTPFGKREHRMSIYLALLANAKSVVFYHFNSGAAGGTLKAVYNNAAHGFLWDYVTLLADELRSHANLWATNVLTTPAVTTSNPEIKAALRFYAGDYYLLAANIHDGGNLGHGTRYVCYSGVTITLGAALSGWTVTTAGLPGSGVGTWDTAGRGVGITNASGAFVDNFDPYGVNLYKISLGSDGGVAGPLQPPANLRIR